MKFILASSSPRRKELLEMMGIKFEIKVSDVDETFKEGLSIEDQSKRLAYIKAKAVFDDTTGDRIIIGSDTMVIKENKIYGKPRNKEEAINMLMNLSVLFQKGESYTEQIDYDIADVYFKEMTMEEIESWIDTGEAYDKARSICCAK